MKKIIILVCIILSFKSFCQPLTELTKVESGIYFTDGKTLTSVDPTIVNTIKTGSLLLSMYGIKQKCLAQIDGKEANYILSTSSKFYFKFKPEAKELNSSNSNATNKVGEQNYMNLLLSGANSKAVSPNEFKLVKLKLKKGKRSFLNGKYDQLGINYQQSIDSKSIIDFKYKKISDNTYEIYFPNGLTPGEYCFVYMAGISKEYNFLQTTNFKVFDFSIK
jgi:hypothetical protein